ncbi:hypothetical protein KBZ19_07265 [Synechococcus sp. L2F]|nr:hypothetical protein [Synechococcus sp. L2F]
MARSSAQVAPFLAHLGLRRPLRLPAGSVRQPPTCGQVFDGRRYLE